MGIRIAEASAYQVAKKAIIHVEKGTEGQRPQVQ